MGAEVGTGLLVLHGNRLELLKEAVVDWLQRQPLAPLEAEVFLVQSNGVAEWLKMALAQSRGVCAATRVELPARFLWRSYRQVLGRQSVPALSPLDEIPLTWRLMRLLPGQLGRAEFAPLARFLDGGDVARRLQLAQRLADLFDQYQVYRADWLEDWAAGRDRLGRADGTSTELPEDQRWQPLLWRELLEELSEAERLVVRPAIHRRFLATLASGAAPRSPVARRVVVFGMSQLPMQMLQALSALSRHTQVLLAVVNPCQYHWADIIDGRELLQMQRRRFQHRADRDLAAVSLEEMHAHAHPLLAAWGRQGRDFVRQLDAFDAHALGQETALPRIDLFDSEPGTTLLARVQAAIRDLQPLAEHPRRPDELNLERDRSIVFHVAHSAQREVEVLHDELLHLLAEPPGGQPLRPRDILVMVPDIDRFAPCIRAVFGQYPPGDPRHIPFGIADQQQRGHVPLFVALEWLLRLPQQRCRLTEVRDLLDVPALARRFDITEEELPRIAQWLNGAGVRWGLDARHRAALGLEACGAQNTWIFGLRRMLLGYAAGDGAAWADIEAYGEIGGLEAAAAGSLAVLVDELHRWHERATSEATPAQWAERARELLDNFFEPVDEAERQQLALLQEALESWLEAVQAGGFEEEVPLEVLREGWLSGLDEPTLRRRFLDGGVTFCTLMPMRAIPFEVVCLLGMNDGDYPRRTHRADFDLMGLPGQRRPGDRSRRDDDRYLMLEALLSARQRLVVSWSGRSVRDNSEQPPSVLVSQLRDYLDAGWGQGLAKTLTTEHPLQPFSRRYFEAGGLRTWAREWRAAHHADTAAAGVEAPRFEVENQVLTLSRLAAFVKNPVSEYFMRRLGVNFDEGPPPGEDDEPFGINGLEAWVLISELLADAHRCAPEEIVRRAQRIQRSGRLPMNGIGARQRDALLAPAQWMHRRWLNLQREFAAVVPKETLAFEHEGVRLEDWLTELRNGASGPVQLKLSPSVLQKKGTARTDKLIDDWVRHLVASACGVALQGRIVSRDAVLALEPLPQDEAQQTLRTLLGLWRQGMEAPLPLACRTALAFVSDGKPQEVYEGGGFSPVTPEGAEPCLARLYPDFETLIADGQFEALAPQLYGPLEAWARGSVKVLEQGDGAEDGDD
ncbi:exodeoxyribonuclease V subunit gamma [Azohydromonas caseinilytica]|uniref:RecBCD enzyme subunit RecC n=1 Tax=Azohydromonas caseinilytica TaxID=2728836 RepID=A0A848FGP8_9BURK|nr:exodeoxyribonuclease V subunit gamma [Azohydromonas caseinilytica]NML18316.1 exodeoxyribonuclease V subunit gamma [Azohydromonas caseinilytica]